jgi:hypothetical protein
MRGEGVVKLETNTLPSRTMAAQFWVKSFWDTWYNYGLPIPGCDALCLIILGSLISKEDNLSVIAMSKYST